MELYLERFSPQRWTPPWIRQQHLKRYQWVSQFAAGASVVDAACGLGYGSDMLRRLGARRVQGFDVSAEAVADAVARYGSRPDLAFDVADVTRLPLNDATCEVYVSFETLEHVHDACALLAEARRVLRRDGKFIVSTPNREVVAAGASLEDRPANWSHVREFSRVEFAALLSGYFCEIQWFGQAPYSARYASALRRVGRHAAKAALRLHQARKVCEALWKSDDFQWPRPCGPAENPEILIAVCGNPVIRRA